MKVMHLNFVKFAACMVLVVGLSARALASCGESLSAMAAGAAAVVSQSRPMQQDSQSSGDDPVNSSIIGLGHIQFTIHDQTIQEAYQLWNAGGTEVHNPNVDPRTGNVCLGVWKRAAPRGTYKLAHRLWNYDANGNFLGTINLRETLTLGHGGNTHSGSFTLDFYEPSGNFLMEVAGSVRGERISVECSESCVRLRRAAATAALPCGMLNRGTSRGLGLGVGRNPFEFSSNSCKLQRRNTAGFVTASKPASKHGIKNG